MAAPTVYRSTDVGAPVMTSAFGTLVDLLDACLVNGYGGTFATNTLTSTGVAPSDGDTVTVDGITYTFKTALTPSANQVLIGASAAAALTNLAAAMSGWGTSGTTYGAGTSQTPNVIVTSVTATVITMQARAAGTGGNAVGLSRVAVTLSVGGANFSGGTTAVNKTAAGWTKSFAGTAQQFGAVYRQLAGKQFYLWVSDLGPGAGLGKEARFVGAESYATAFSSTIFTNATNAFPVTAQRSTGLFCRKSATLDSTARPWILYADDRTFYLFVLTGDIAGGYMDICFGDFYSVVSADAYNCMVGGRPTENSAAAGAATIISVSTAWNTSANIFVARAFTGTGGSQQAQTQADTALAQALQYPNNPDGCVYASRLYVAPNVAGAAVAARHGYLRGFYQFEHAAANVIDGDSFASSSGEFAAKTFNVVKTDSNGIPRLLETTAWDIST